MPLKDSSTDLIISMIRCYIQEVPCLLDRESDFNRILEHYRSGRIKLALNLFDTLWCEFAQEDQVVHLSQLKGFLFKRPVSGDINREKVALDQFISDENRCAETNRNLLDSLQGNDDWVRVMRIARFRIHSLLGHLTPGKIDRIIELSRPGSGLAQGAHNHLRCAPIYKWVAFDPTMYAHSSYMVDRLLASMDRAFFDGREVVNSSRVSFVPKDVKTHRSIAIEPNLSMMCQLGVHEYLLRRLKTVNIDITDQSWNQILAYLGSIDSNPSTSLCTIDLSSASDLISLELVRFLVPSDWFSLLSSLRPVSWSYKGIEHKLNKFSTMGNGMTFALETLIFWAITTAVWRIIESTEPDTSVSVYGDDIICPTRHSGLLIETLSKVGLTVNLGKSFFLGCFRESCGTDWYAGKLVTPLKIKDVDLSESGCYRLINRWGKRPASTPIRSLLISHVKQHFRKKPLLGLENEDDGSCIFHKFSYLRDKGYLSFNRYWQNWTFRALKEFGVKDSSCPVDWRYLNSLLGDTYGDACPSLRGRTKVRTTRATGGRLPPSWYDLFITS